MRNLVDSVTRIKSRLSLSLRATFPVLAMGAVALAGAMFSTSANAVPSFANQTQQSCVACHAGGAFFELTPYGRIFKLTGYTQGEKTTPFSAMLIGEYTSIAKNDDGAGGQVTQYDNTAMLTAGSIFIAGKATENIGGFWQMSTSFSGGDANGNPVASALTMDQFDLRYSDRKLDPNSDLIWGLTLHNNPGVQDVFNTYSSAFSFPMQGPSWAPNAGNASFNTLSQLEGGVSHVAGYGAYMYWNKTIYAEVSTYQTASGGMQFLRYTDDPTTYTNLDGNSLYARLAYTKDWGPNSLMVGGVLFDTRVFPTVPNGPLGATGFNGAADTSAGSTHYRDVGIDAQYQYILSPNVFSAQFSYISESVDASNGDGTQTPAGFALGQSNTLTSMMAKASYVYRDRYGASLTYRSGTTSTDTVKYANGKGDTELWVPEVFFMPIKNVRVGLQYNMFTKFDGVTSNYDGLGRNPSDNNNVFIYFWAAL